MLIQITYKHTLLVLSLIIASLPSYAQDTQTAIFAGGCFWCSESDFEKVEGVVDVISGYTGGQLDNPTYKQVSKENTGHYEAVQISYDPTKVSYRELVDHFWLTIDPTDEYGQFCDKGASYRSAIFYQNEEEKSTIQSSLGNINKTKPFTNPVVTEILTAATFFPAEDYHQDYYKKNPLRYKYYRRSCGREKRLKQLWGDQLH